MLSAIFATSTVLLLLFTLLPLLHIDHWLVRVLDFPRLQMAALALLLLGLGAWLLDGSSSLTWIMLAVTLGCLVYHLWWIMPYTRLAKVEVWEAGSEADGQVLSLLNANVLGTNRNAKALLALVREYQPHILLTLESDAWWQEQLDELEADYPYTIKCPLDNLYGMHVYSRLPLSECTTAYLVEEDIPSMHAFVHLPGGETIGAHFLHPRPPSPTESLASSPRDAELIIVGRKVAENKSPVVVAGDLNDVAWSRTTRLFRKLSGLRDPRVGRGMFNTFHAGYPFLRWPLDHLFHSDHFTLKTLLRLPSIDSDHFPLYSKLVYDGQRRNPARTLKPDEDDLDLAREKMTDEGVSESDVPDRERPRNPGESGSRLAT
jgi:endonuclease/exonuclease/phosphatase (EEP) superfamily protein YafD